MPPLPKLRVPCLHELARQTRFLPAEPAHRQLVRALKLIEAIDPDQTYPEDWVLFRITGYRPEMHDPAMLVGAAVITDAAALAEHLSVAAALGADDLAAIAAELDDADRAGAEPSAWSSADELCERWSISRKTLDRYRKLGLPAVRIGTPGRGPTGPGSRLLFPSRAVEQFERRFADRLAAASTFQRLAPEIERRITKHAARYHRRFGCTLNQAAQRLAIRYGRSHEAVRNVLQRHEAAPSAMPPGADETAPEG
ncbi:MAG: hypothetical protein H7Y88_02875, partial [Phycisphaerales bacterium]|nr:hypothetical protein [Phycisphaerales bacterium]